MSFLVYKNRWMERGRKHFEKARERFAERNFVEGANEVCRGCICSWAGKKEEDIRNTFLL